MCASVFTLLGGYLRNKLISKPNRIRNQKCNFVSIILLILIHDSIDLNLNGKSPILELKEVSLKGSGKFLYYILS